MVINYINTSELIGTAWIILDSCLPIRNQNVQHDRIEQYIRKPSGPLNALLS